MKWSCAKGAQTQMNKNANFVETESRFFTERIDLVHEIELTKGKHKHMSPRLRAIVSRSTQMKISFFSLPFFLFNGFQKFLQSWVGVVLFSNKKISLFTQILYR